MRHSSLPALLVTMAAVVLPPMCPVGSPSAEAQPGLLRLVLSARHREKSERVARFTQVTKGITRDEVIAAIGAPPGDYTTRPFSDPPTTSGWAMFARGVERWVYDDARLLVQFRGGRAVRVEIQRPFLPPLPPRRP